MPLGALAQVQLGVVDGVLLFERRHVHRRRWRRLPQDPVQHPRTAFHRTGTRRMRRHCQHAGHGQHATAVWIAQLYAHQLRTFDRCFLAIEPGQRSVEKCVIAIDEFDQRTVLAQDGVEQQRGLVVHRRAQVLGHLRVLLLIDGQRGQAVDTQPRCAETTKQHPRPGVGDQPLHLRRQHGRITQRSVRRPRQQFVIRHGGPEQVR